MEATQELESYQDELAAVLTRRRAYLEEEVLPALRERLTLMVAQFTNVYNLLLKKGLVKEDPYRLDQKISEVTVPPRQAFPESARVEQMSIRLSSYHLQFEFLLNYYEFTLEFLTLQRLKLLVGLVRYIDYRQLTENSPSPTTAGLAALLSRITGGSDSFAAGIVHDSVAQLAGHAEVLLKQLSEVAAFQKENYKLTLRRDLFIDERLRGLDPTLSDEQKIVAVKRVFASRMAGTPFYRELVAAILEEDYNADQDQGRKLRREVLRRLEVKKAEKKPAERREKSFRPLLMQSLELLITASVHLRKALAVARENAELLREQERGLAARIRRFLQEAAGKKGREQQFEIEYFDESRGARHSEVLDFEEFSAQVQRIVHLFAAVSNKMSVPRRKVEEASEEQLFGFVNKHAAAMQAMAVRLEALEHWFKSEAPRERRQRIRSARQELSALRDSLAKANRRKHEYVSRKEEEEQFKKLGIARES